MTPPSAVKRKSPHNNMNHFHAALRSSRRIIALCGAGLSASSGLPTFRGAGGLWRNNDATALATPRAFKTDPGLVWLFYGYRRHMSLVAEPNDAHRALAALADNVDHFLCLTQNVDSRFDSSIIWHLLRGHVLGLILGVSARLVTTRQAPA